MMDNYIFLGISVGIPIVLIIILMVKYKVSFKVIGIGLLTFLVSQVFFRIPILDLINRLDPGISRNIIYQAQLPFTAGLVEVGADYIAFRWFLNNCNTSDAVGLGIAHGLCENLYVALPILLTGVNIGGQSTFIGSFERSFALLGHLAFCLFAYYAVKKKKIRFLIYGILLHALADMFCILPLGIWSIEICCALVSIISFIIITTLIIKNKNYHLTFNQK